METTTAALAARQHERAFRAAEVGRHTGDPDRDEAALSVVEGREAPPMVVATLAAEARLLALPPDANSDDAIEAVGDPSRTLLREMTGRGWRAKGHLGGWYFGSARGPLSECAQRAERV